MPDVWEQEEQLGLSPGLLLHRASWLADVMYESVCDGVEHDLHRRHVVEGLHGAGAEREGPWRREEHKITAVCQVAHMRSLQKHSAHSAIRRWSGSGSWARSSCWYFSLLRFSCKTFQPLGQTEPCVLHHVIMGTVIWHVEGTRCCLMRLSSAQSFTWWVFNIYCRKHKWQPVTKLWEEKLKLMTVYVLIREFTVLSSVRGEWRYINKSSHPG